MFKPPKYATGVLAAVGAMTFASGLAPAPALAIDADTGWVHEETDYRDGTGGGYNGVDCMGNSPTGCIGYTNTGSFGFPIVRTVNAYSGSLATAFQNAVNAFANGSTTANGMRTPHGPYYNTGNPSVWTGTLNTGGTALPADTCGRLNASYLVGTLPDNGGLNGSQNSTISSGIIRLNSNKSYYFTSDVAAGGCNAPATFSHELGHTAGLAHTGYTGQVMSQTSFGLNYQAGGGDKRAQRCIYEFDAIKAATPSVDPCHQ